MPRRYVTIDVFTDRAFGGNPLAVVLDAEGLSTARMQAIAREFNYSETTFVLPPADPANTAQVRIFTPSFEMPFAGHPNVGTALVLAARAATPRARVVFEEIAGFVPIEIQHRGGRPVAAELTAPRLLSRGGNADPAKVAAAVGLDASDILLGAHRPTMATVGAPFLFAELASRAALGHASGEPARLATLLAASETVGLFLYTFDGADAARDVHARMFFLAHGVVEDPGTGSAAVAFAALRASLAPAADLVLSLRVSQGEDMGRPSLLATRAVKQAGRVVSAHVGGGGVEMMTGTLADLGAD